MKVKPYRREEIGGTGSLSRWLCELGKWRGGQQARPLKASLKNWDFILRVVMIGVWTQGSLGTSQSQVWPTEETQLCGSPRKGTNWGWGRKIGQPDKIQGT